MANDNGQVENKIGDLKKFFTSEGETMSIVEFKAEWDQLSDQEKDWFKSQPLS